MRNAAVILSSNDLMLSGEVFMPDDCERSYPAVCLCHGIPAVRYNPDEKGGYPEIAVRFCSAGFVALAFNFRGAGPSQGDFDMMGWVDDLAVALEFLRMIPEVDKTRICLLGSSGGAAVSIYTAAHDPGIFAVATLACPAEFDFMASGYTVDSLISSFRDIGIIKDPCFPTSTEKWLEGFKNISPIRYIDKISPRPLLLVHGDKDETVPVDHAGRLYDRAGVPKEMTILAGAGHRLRLDERAVTAALNWMSDKVKK